MPDGRAAVWRTSDAGLDLAAARRGLPQRDAHLGVLREGMAIDTLDVPGLYFGTSTGQVFASADEGETWNEIASYLPAHRVGRGGGGRASHGRRSTFPPRCRRCSPTCRAASRSRPATVAEAIDRLDERWPGLRDRLCEPGPALRRHINVYVDRERAELATPLRARPRGST